MTSDVENVVFQDDYNLNDVYKQENFEFTRLTDMVRTHYVQYLEKQLHENLKKWHQYHPTVFNLDYYKEPIRKTVTILENGAVKACMITQLYQRAMLKIISGVKHLTQEQRLVKTLEEILNEKEYVVQTKDKCIQTCNNFNYNDKQSSLHLNSFNASIDTSVNENKRKFFEDLNEIDDKNQVVENNSNGYSGNSNADTVQTVQKSSKDCKSLASVMAQLQSPILLSRNSENIPPTTEEENMNDIDKDDDVALELARIFSEEKTELDDIFGINPDGEPDDPQICSILQEIQNAKNNLKNNKKDSFEINTSNQDTTMKILSTEHPKTTTSQIETNGTMGVHEHLHRDNRIVDLNKSLWPCELFMQRRKLSESLSRLVDEDFRWIDIMKWKFTELFGDDSDDEFATCSPTIELNEVLINSCIRRISPWVVKYLMKPMKEGLIGNRYLFKRLAKQLARSIILENQYPNEWIVKYWIENIFCLNRAILSLDDIRDLPQFVPQTY